MSKKKKHKSRWKYYYWFMVVTIFIALIFMVRFVLNSSKVYVDRITPIYPHYIEWGLERDASLRIKEPYFVKTNPVFIRKDLDKLSLDSSIYVPLIEKSNSGSTLKDVNRPYLIWKNANSDTIHVLKNNILLQFLMVSD
ncbi:MAG: hypothetical protein GX159_11770 [Flavobacteriaceae bacterium]|nr:hypothetical protein [Flavobacteriaceae bacterium]